MKGNNVVRYGDDRSRAYQTISAGALGRGEETAERGKSNGLQTFVTRQQK
jgi:hypothetical protein